MIHDERLRAPILVSDPSVFFPNQVAPKGRTWPPSTTIKFTIYSYIPTKPEDGWSPYVRREFKKEKGTNKQVI